MNTDMNTKTLSPEALAAIEQYLHMKVGAATARVPYFNNKTARTKLAVRVMVGKGTPREIAEEAQTVLVKNHVSPAALTGDALAKLLADNGLGIDCSGLAYYILDAESRARGTGHLNRHLSFVSRRGPVGKMRAYLRPAENCDVKTFASDMNSRPIMMRDVRAGDLITMLGTSTHDATNGGMNGTTNGQRDHMLVIHRIDYADGVPRALHYTHSIAYPKDGLYGTGVRQGTIDLISIDGPLTEQVWSEEGSIEKARDIFARAAASKMELRRLKWFE